MQAFINELSLPLLPSDEAVIVAFSGLGKCYEKASKYGINEIKIKTDFYNHQFAPGYSFINWLDDEKADKDLRTLLKSIMLSTPYIDDIFDTYQTQNNEVLSMYYQDQICFGLGLASENIFNTISFSFYTSNWTLPKYPISINTYDEDETGKLNEVSQTTSSRNISTEKHCEEHKDFIQIQEVNTIQNGRELWFRKAELFPNLRFCGGVEGQISGIYNTTMGFHQIMLRLFDLQNTAARINKKSIEPSDFPTKTTLESESRLREFKKQLTIVCPDGESRLFSWHSRCTPGSIRIHFIPFENEEYFLIGSIANQNSIK